MIMLCRSRRCERRKRRSRRHFFFIHIFGPFAFGWYINNTTAMRMRTTSHQPKHISFFFSSHTHMLQRCSFLLCFALLFPDHYKKNASGHGRKKNETLCALSSISMGLPSINRPKILSPSHSDVLHVCLVV